MTQPHPLASAFHAGSYAAVFAPLDSEGRAAAVARRLGDSIALSMLPDGSPLPPEADLAERYGVATVTVREALAELRAAGLIRTRRGRGGGSFVCAPADGGRAALTARLRETSMSEWRDLVDYYGVVAGGSAALAAERADDGDVARLRALADRDGVGGVRDLARHEGQFHLDLAATAHSARLTREEVALQGELGPVLWSAHALVGAAEQIRHGHQAVVAAVATTDPAAARQAMHHHIADLFTALRTLAAQNRRPR